MLLGGRYRLLAGVLPEEPGVVAWDARNEVTQRQVIVHEIERQGASVAEVKAWYAEQSERYALLPEEIGSPHLDLVNDGDTLALVRAAPRAESAASLLQARGYFELHEVIAFFDQAFEALALAHASVGSLGHIDGGSWVRTMRRGAARWRLCLSPTAWATARRGWQEDVGNTARVLVQHSRSPVPTPDALRAAMQAWFYRATSADPAARFGSAAEALWAWREATRAAR